ncbi:unnamed protein product [Dimorphilus gyrociliatus]|uniref:Uncharacterized protein n=1 Tax=Dimorphilus gyrociliatus TaxID=2664684 RepID=A0A7I8WB77_9ANNE|nr:unnamed protein product [Dimorphilus gyrociliatus]
MWRSPIQLHRVNYKRRRVIYLQPLGEFPDFIHNFSFENIKGFFQVLQKYLSVFFYGFDVQILPQRPYGDYKTRVHQKTEKEQILVGPVLSHLGSLLPSDGATIIGASWIDLYPSENLNFLLGQGSLATRSAVFCFGRFEPRLDSWSDITKIDAELMWKIIKVVLHETCHTFGLLHCKYYACLMNESSSIEEACSQPQLLCPVCLRKVQYVVKFGLKERYEAQEKFLTILCQAFETEAWQKTLANIRTCILHL